MNHRRRLTIRLVLAHVLIGPFLVGLMFCAGQWLLDPDFTLLDDRGSMLPPPLDFAVAYLKLSPIFYAPGLAPAIATGLLTAARVRSAGRCGLRWAATYGALTSAILVGMPSLVFTSALVSSHGWPTLPTAAGLVALQGTFGFLGTIPVWFATEGLRRKIAAEHHGGRLKPEAAALASFPSENRKSAHALPKKAGRAP
jgi:hypothetical protein